MRRDLVAGRTVLEVGCGEGYGTALLAAAADVIVGIDYDALTMAHARATYPRRGLRARQPGGAPGADGNGGHLVTLQVIEHVWDHAEFVAGVPPRAAPGRPAAGDHARTGSRSRRASTPGESRFTPRSSPLANWSDCSRPAASRVERDVGSACR